jgi:hypothetical protein
MPIGWMWPLAWSRFALPRPKPLWPKNENCESASAAPHYTLRSIHNDSRGLSRLSKIAHMRPIWIAGYESTRGNFPAHPRVRPRPRVVGSAGPFGPGHRGQVELPPTIETDFVGAVLDGEPAAQVTVPAAKDGLKNFHERFHKSCALCRRSQHPLASSHSRSERTLARARAIAQSAAP